MALFDLAYFFALYFNYNLLECVGKFGALFASIPFTIFAAVYCVMFGLVGKQIYFSLYYDTSLH